MNISQALASSVKVAVRVRPFNKREKKAKSRCIVKMYDNATFIVPPEHLDLPPEKQNVSQFTFDYSFWSLDKDVKDDVDINNDHCPFVDQVDVFNNLGKLVLDNAYQGYNCAVLAYGQTGSGKTHSQMGGNTPETEGLVPRICRALFQKRERDTSPSVRFTVDITYLEIYAEQINDLLSANKSKTDLRVREHPKTGPYVENLSKFAVDSYDELYDWMMRGNAMRATAATNMNDRSSRSHSIFTITFTQHFTASNGTKRGSMVSKINMVDLAGSERVKDSGVTGVHLKEAININRSLTTLGRVISALATSSANKKGGQTSQNVHVPFRDSVLTWILKDSLGGNSKTVMIATISPAAINYEESLSTLLYASHAKEIVNEVTVNADVNDRLVKDMQNDIRDLRERMSAMLKSGLLNDDDRRVFDEYQNRLLQSEQLVAQFSEPWEDRLIKTKELYVATIQHNKSRLLTLSSTSLPSLRPPCLIDISPTHSVHRDLLTYLQPGTATDGTALAEGMMCIFNCDDDHNVVLTKYDEECEILINNNASFTDEYMLKHNDTIRFKEYMFKFKKSTICQ